MPSRENPEAILIRREEWAAARARQSLPRSWPSGQSSTKRAPPPSPVPRTEPAPQPGTLSARRLKVSTMLDAAELLSVPAPEGRPRITLRIRLPDRTATAEIAAKSLRRAQTTIREHGADNVACVLQGHLVAGDAIAEAGLSAQAKATKAPTR